MSTETASFVSSKYSSVSFSALFQASAPASWWASYLKWQHHWTQAEDLCWWSWTRRNTSFIIFYNYLYLTKKAAWRFSQSLNGTKYYLLFFLLVEREELSLILMCRCTLAATREKKEVTLHHLYAHRKAKAGTITALKRAAARAVWILKNMTTYNISNIKASSQIPECIFWN